MAVQSTGIVWATQVTDNTGGQWWPTSAGTGAPDGDSVAREVDNNTLDIQTACLHAGGYHSALNSLLPPNLIFRGFKVYVVRRADALVVSDTILQMANTSNGSGILGTNKAKTSTFWGGIGGIGIYETSVYGAEDDLWSYEWNRLHLTTSANFGVLIGAGYESGSITDIYVDAVGVEVFHEETKTTGPLFPGAALSSGWTNPNNAKADDTSYATRTFAGSEDPGVATGGVYLSDFGVSIPAGSTILGCAAVNGRFATTAGIRDRFVQLHQGGTLIGANKWVSGSNWGTGSTGTVTYGYAPNDHWGVAGGLTPQLVNDPSFGIVFEARNNNASARQANIDFASLEFHYIEPDEPIDLAPGNLATGAPDLDGLQLGQEHALAPGGFGVAAPVLEVPDPGQRHVLAIGAIATGVPDVDAPAVGSFQDIAFSGVTAGWPVLGSPSVSIADPVVLLGIASVAPMLGEPALGSIHVLVPGDVDAGAPVLGMPGTGSLNVFVIAAIAAGAPMPDLPVLGQFVPPFEWRPAEPVPGFWTPVAATDVEWSS